MPKKEKLQTCSTGGGPVIGIAAELAGKWRGTLAPIGAAVPPGWQWGTPGGPTCDYDRACGKVDHPVAMPRGGFGAVPLDGGLALVFQGSLNVAWLPTAEGGIVVRNVPDELETVADLLGIAGERRNKTAFAIAAPPAGWKAWPGKLTLQDGRLFFWDSAMEGAGDPKKIETNGGGVAVGTPGPGTYALATAVDDGENDDYKLHFEYVKLTRI
jgi:hypothetical protein